MVRVKEPNHPWAWDRFHKHGVLYAVWDSIMLHRWAPLDAIVEDIIRVCHEEKPDLILGDASIGVSTAGHIAGYPAAGVMNAYNAEFVRPGSIYRPFIHAWDWLMLAPVRRRVYRRHGIKQANAFALLQDILLLSPDLPQFHPELEGFPHWKAVGPILTEPPCELPDWFDELDDGKKNIYISMGSTGLLDQILLRIFPAFSEAPYRFLVTTGGHVAGETLAKAPGNFRFADYAPGPKLLEHCQALIFHGGNGTLYQGLAAGVPMIALPTHLEQTRCARVLAEYHIGFLRSGRRATGPQLLRDLRTLLEDPAYRRNGERLKEAVRASTGPEEAAKLLIAHARSGNIAGARLGR